MTTLRAVIAILLLFGVYLIGLVGVALAGAAVVLCAMSLGDYLQGYVSTFPTQLLLFLIGSIATLVAVLGGLFTVSRAAVETDSVRVDEQDAPRLWAFVREVAAEAGIRPPDELRLNGDVNASVSEDSRLLGLLPGRRRLHLGLPLLAELSANELRALLGHEFGHYIGWHTRAGVVVYRGYLALDRLRHNLTEANVTVWGPAGLMQLAFAGYTRLYARISFAVRRRQEFEADAVAARIAGPRAAAQALRSLAAIDAHWQVFTRNYLRRGAIAGYAPEDPLAMFVAMLSDPQRRKAMDRLKAQAPAPEAYNRYASHPSMADRLARLAEMDGDGPARLHEPTPSTWAYPRRELLRHLLPSHRFESLPAAQWLDKAGRLAAPSARPLLEAAGPTLDSVLNALEEGAAPQLAARLDAEDPHRGMARLCEALHALVGHYLVEAGSAHWRLSWTGPSELVVSELRSDGVHVLPFAEINALVFDAVDHHSGVDRLRLHLASLRVDPERSYVAGTERTTSVTVDTEPMRRERDRRKRVLVYGGVMLAAVVGFLVFAQVTPRTPPHVGTTYVPTLAPPPTFRYFPSTGMLLPSFPPTLPSFDFTVTGPITVVAGDTLAELARCHLTTVADLQQLNGLGDATDLQVGQTLLVPNVLLGCH